MMTRIVTVQSWIIHAVQNQVNLQPTGEKPNIWFLEDLFCSDSLKKKKKTVMLGL